MRAFISDLGKRLRDYLRKAILEAKPPKSRRSVLDALLDERAGGR